MIAAEKGHTECVDLLSAATIHAENQKEVIFPKFADPEVKTES